MDFASLMKAGIDRKRKKLEEKQVIKDGKTYFHRSDLVEAERQEYEKAHGIKRYKKEPKKDTKEIYSEVLAEIAPDEEKLPMTLSRQEVVRRLRDRNEPIRLFGESDYEAFQRLRKLEITTPDINKGLRNDFKAAMDQLEQDNIDEIVKQQTAGSSGLSLNVADDGTTMESLQEESKNVNNDVEKECDLILRTMKFLLRCRAKELCEMPDDKKKKVQWKTQSAIHRQTETYLAPLFAQLKKRTVATDILDFLSAIIKHVLQRNYVEASAIYLQMAIGNAPWPIGVTMVGIHARTGREKIFSQQIAHVLNDETQRKFIQGLKRLISVCQRIYPTDPSKSLEYHGLKTL